ncbi:hypothetical protein CcCBS67573_g04453 [Chytriomyces confervae]|uniref:Uncharacterized protein n=1 Tax=Chytriomyces confervae TaxID=246404 RepID=A0A507FDQ8_9FUNG|nr:hypothetical protein CcCBS67573_g04453 [Chytriomyces confervae]
MLTSLITIIASSQLALAALPQVQRCDPQTLPDGWVAGQVTAPLKQVAQYLISDPNKKLFMIKGLTYTDSNESAWFAGLGNDGEGIKLSADAPTAADNQDTKPFTLIRSIGASYSWKTINQVRLFEMTNQQLICTADLPSTGSSANNAISPAVGAPGAGTSARVTMAPAPPASGPTSGAAAVKVSQQPGGGSGSSGPKSAASDSKSTSGTSGSRVWGVAETLVAVTFALLV